MQKAIAFQPKERSDRFEALIMRRFSKEHPRKKETKEKAEDQRPYYSWSIGRSSQQVLLANLP